MSVSAIENWELGWLGNEAGEWFYEPLGTNIETDLTEVY